MVLGVPILKHFRVVCSLSMLKPDNTSCYLMHVQFCQGMHNALYLGCKIEPMRKVKRQDSIKQATVKTPIVNSFAVKPAKSKRWHLIKLYDAYSAFPCFFLPRIQVPL